MMVHYSGFKLTREQAQRLLTSALDQLLAGVPLATNGHGKRLGRPAGKRTRGRKPMTAAERKAVSRRMKAMWKKRRAAGDTGRLDT
jgi:hypothetical protein